MTIKQEVSEWMQELGFQDNSEAEIPNYQLSLGAYMDPNPLIEKVERNNPNWDTIEDITMISPEVAELFYRVSKRLE